MAAAASDSTSTQGSASRRSGSSARDGLYNLIGWAWPVVMSVVTVPYFLHLLGEELYGIYAVIAIVGGYLSMVSTPASAGNVRFLAASLGHQDWAEVRSFHVNGIYVNSAIAALSAAVLFIAADWLSIVVFKVPQHLAHSAADAFRIGAIGYFLNGVAGALRSLPFAASRFDWVNGVTLVAGTANTLFAFIALWLGFGLYGAVVGQVLSSIVAVLGFQFASVRLLKGIPGGADEPPRFNIRKAKVMLSFSGLMFIEQALMQISGSIDRTIVGVQLGAASITYYAIPSRISDLVQGIASALAKRLYPIAAGASGSQSLEDLKEVGRNYITSLRTISWIACALATVLISCSYDLLTVWLGRAMADKSATILILLTCADAGLAIGHVAHYTSLGLGRADINLVFRALTLGLTIVLGPVLLYYMGLTGVAWAMMIVYIPIQFVFSIYVPLKLLHKSMAQQAISIIVRITATVAVVVSAVTALPTLAVGVWGLLLKLVIVSTAYVVTSLILGALSRSDISAITSIFMKKMRRQSI